MRVLLVEDTEDVAEAIVANFSRSGHAIDRVTGCGAARDAVAVQDYDLVILDINLPDGSGFDVLKAMRGAKNATPILGLIIIAVITGIRRVFARGKADTAH